MFSEESETADTSVQCMCTIYYAAVYNKCVCVLQESVSDGEKEEYMNESVCYGDLDVAIPMLKLVERQGNQNEKLLNAKISNVIGRRLHDFDVMGKEVGLLHGHFQCFILCTHH